MDWKQFLKADVRKITLMTILVLPAIFAMRRFGTLFILVILYLLSCLVISITDNLRRIGMVLLMISLLIGIPMFSSGPSGLIVILFSIPLFLASLFIFLISFISKKAPLEENRSKYGYPVLTKIVAVGLILFSIFASLSVLKHFLNDYKGCALESVSLGCLYLYFRILIPYFILTYLGILILKRSKRAWWATIIIFIFLLITMLSDNIILNEIEDTFFPITDVFRYNFHTDIRNIISILFFAVPTFLLFVDRKNFFKIAE